MWFVAYQHLQIFFCWAMIALTNSKLQDTGSAVMVVSNALVESLLALTPHYFVMGFSIVLMPVTRTRSLVVGMISNGLVLKTHNLDLMFRSFIGWR